MSKLLAFLLGLAALQVAVAAEAATTPTLTLHVSSPRVLYGHGVTLSGRLAGGIVAGRTVVIDARPYGTSAPHAVAVVSTGLGGKWSYRVNPTIQTSYDAHAAGTKSLGITVGVAPRVIVTELGNGRLRAEIDAVRPFGGRMIELQRLTVGHTWSTIARKRLSPASIAVLSPKLSTSIIRVAMSINQAGAGYLGAASHPLVYRSELLTMAPSAFKVEYGHPLTLAGRLVNGPAGTRVSIFARAYGSSVPKKLATVRTGSAGRFSLTVRPSIRTVYRAAVAGLQSPAAVTVGVQPTLVLRELTGGHLLASVTGGKAFAGASVKLQRMAGTTWHTVAKQQLGTGSSTIFTLRLPDSMVRLALSVNQAGAGYLGSTSHSLVYRAV